MVGATGLEPATSRPPDGRATGLRYAPTLKKWAKIGGNDGAWLIPYAALMFACIRTHFANVKRRMRFFSSPASPPNNKAARQQ